MSTTTRNTPDLGTRLHDIHADISRTEGELADLQMAEQETIERHREKGDLTSQQAVREIHKAAEAARAHEERLEGLRRERERIIAEGQKSGPVGGAGRGLLALSFHRGEIDQLRQAALRRTSYSVPSSVGLHAVTAPTGGYPDLQLPTGRLFVEFAREQTRIADLMPQRPVDGGMVSYLSETVASTAAAPVAPGALKPASSPTFAKVSKEPQTIAHVATVNNQDLMDLDGALGVIGGSLLRGLVAAENQQLLSGDGTGAEQLGFLDGSSGVPTISRTTDEPRLDLILRAITSVRTVGFTGVDALVLHPSDYLNARLERATSGSEEYLAGSALSASAQDLWAVRTVLTTDIPQGTGLTGNFENGAELWVRESPRIDAGTVDDDYQRNRTTLRCEERIWLAITRPAYFAAISFS